MATWGQPTNLGSNFAQDTAVRIIGGDGPAGAQQITSINLYGFMTSGTGDVRLGVYTGGTLTDPSGASLLWDAGKVTLGVTEQAYQITHSGVSLPGGQVLWLAWRTGVSALRFKGSTSSVDAGDFQSARGRFNTTLTPVDENTAFPSSLGDQSGGSFGNFWYSLWLEITPDAGGGKGGIVHHLHETNR